MGETDGETPEGEAASMETEDRSTPGPGLDTLKVPAGKRRKIKSPTPGERRSATPVRGRSQTPFSLYMNRRSATPSGTAWRSITPFLKREEKEKTPFQLGKDIKAQLLCNKMVFDKALVMDISEAEVEPVRYLTSDMSVIDRAAVMDVSNVEVIYVVEEYEEEEFEEEEIEEVVVVKKKPKRGGRKAKSVSVETRASESPAGDQEEESPGPAPAKEKKTKKRAEKKEKHEKSPSPKISLKLELGGGPKASKKMFDSQGPPPPPASVLPPKKAGKSKLALQMEEQAKAAAKAAEEAAAREANKEKKETFEERQKRLKAEAEEKARIEAEIRRIEEEEAAAAAAEEAEEEDEGDEEEGEDGEYGEDASQRDPDDEDNHNENNTEEEENADEKAEQAEEKRRASGASVDSFTRPDPEEEERWKQIAEEEGEEFVEKLRKFSRVQRQWSSEKERDAEWQKRREQARLPAFINFLTDRASEEGQTVKLACAVTGPELSTKWFKDGKQLEPGPKHRIINNNNILTLQIINCDMMDSGEYSCTIKNSNDEVTSSCIVTIYQVFKDEPSPPTVSCIRDFYHLHDDELTIECHIHGIPRPKVSWIKDNFEIKPSFKFTILEEAHGIYKLLIYRPSTKDSGKYVCKAVNASGEQEVSHTIEFTKPKHFHAHNFISQSIEDEAKKAMDDALKSKAESDNKRQPVASRTRTVDEPLVAPKQKLKFATQLRDRIALENATVKLICNIIGPNPAVKWLKDDNPLQWGPKIKNLSSEGQAVLQLTDVGTASSGVYKLIAKNDHSEIDTSCYLKVYSAQTEGDESEPMFALPIKDVYHSSENDLIISTKVRGNPRPTITWLKDELAVVADSRTEQIEHLDGICELIINKPTQRENSGVYTCVAENKLGSAKTIHTVVIDNLPSSRRSSTTMSLGGGTETDGAKLKKEGSTGGTDGTPKPPKREKREKKEEPVEESGGRRRVAMPDPSLKEKLYFIVNMTNRYLPVGSKCKMQAVIGGPDPQIKWLKNQQPVVYGPKIRNMSNSGMAILEFLNATAEDSGEYTLICRNQANEITTTAILHIYDTKVSSDAEPVFTRALKDTYHLHTNELILESHVRGQPAPTVQWFKDSVQITNNEKYQINELPDGTCELVIDKPNQHDTGKYVCKAENSAGICEISHVVLFQSKPTHIAENIHGVFHADKNLFKKQKDGEKSEEKSETGDAGDTESVSSKGKGKGKGKAKPPSSSKETTPATKESEPKEPEKPIKEEKREKRIGIYFATKLSDRVVAEGSRVKLSCYVQCPDPQVRWFKNDQPVVYGPKSKQMLMQGLCTLELPNATEDDSGIYKCFAKDNTGEVTTTCKITVYPLPGSGDVPPTFTRSIKDNYRQKMNELVLDVHVRGLPTPTATWVKDGVKLEPSEKYQMTQHDDGTCELFISDPLPRDGGKYICKAENRADEVEIVHIVHVDARNLRPVSPAKEHHEPEEDAAKESVTREGSKTRESSNTGESKPPTREGSKVQDDNKEEKKEKKGKKKQEVEYAGRREPPPPPDTKRMLHFGNFLSNRTVTEGSTVRMSVYIGGPDPQCRWFKGEQSIAYTPKTKMSCQDNLALLILTQLTEEDSDEYKLVARGTENTIETSCNVLVYKIAKEQLTSPVFTVGIKDSYQSHCNQIILECKLTGNPMPNIIWQKDNLDISFSSRLKFEKLSDGVMQLIINDPIQDDTGIYTCLAENNVGKMKISKFLDITDHIRLQSERKEHKRNDKNIENNDINQYSKTDFKKTGANEKLYLEQALKNVCTGMKNNVTLCCMISGNPEEILWSKDNQEIDISSTKYKISNRDGLISLEIKDTIVEDSGQYQCFVKNEKNEIISKSEVLICNKLDSSQLPGSFSSQIKESYDGRRNEIILECEVHGRPKISWYKNNNLLLPTTRYRQIDGIGGIRKLIIRNPVPNDFDSFICRAENDNQIDEISTIIKRNILETDIQQDNSNNEQYTNGFERADSGYSTVCRDRFSSSTPRDERRAKSVGRDTSYHRDARKKPLFTTRLCDRQAIENSSIRLTCNILGANDTDITWLKNNQPLQNSSRYRQLFDNGLATLEIFSVLHDDTGSYSCVAENDYGESFSYCQLKVYKGYESAQQPIVFTRFIRDIYSLNENELTLDCRVRGNPRPTIKWTKDSEPIVNNDKYNQLDQADGYCKLIISNPTAKDSGKYVCEAENSVQCEKISHEVVFAGQERFIQEKTHGFFHRDPNKPHFLSSLGNHIVTIGGTIAIQAEFVKTNSEINVEWLKNKVPLSSAQTVKKFVENGVYTLAISDASPEQHDGLYTCRAVNAFGKAESSANVHISTDIGKSKMVIFLSRPEPDMKIAVGDPFSISFRVQGDPKPKLTLMKGTKDITRSDRVSKEASDDYTRFTIHNSKLSDSGTYFVVARNENSTDRIFITVTVRQRARSVTPTLPRWGKTLDNYSDFSYFKNPPGPISTEPMIVDSGKHHISLSWGKPSVDRDSAPVVAYRVDAWMIGSDGGAVWKELGITGLNSFDAFDLKPGSSYHFRVTPRNRYGWGESVKTTYPITIGGAECLPEFVKILPGQMKALAEQECILECTVRGTPRPRIVWYKDGQPIPSTDRVMIKQIGYTCKLRISQVFDIDSGRYTCEAANNTGRVSTFARLQVVSDPKICEADNKLKMYVANKIENEANGEIIPMFTMRLRDRRVQVTYPVRMTCQIVGFPPAEVTWYKNGNEIENDGRFLCCDDGQFNTLEISKTCLDDSGTYTATAKNDMGSVSCHCSLIVDKGIRAYIAPDFYQPLDPVYKFQEGHEIRLSAKVEAYPSVGVAWHRNGTRLRPSRRILATLNHDGFVELIIADATLKDAGIYVCVASNPVGRIESSCRVVIEEGKDDSKIRKIPMIKSPDMPYSKEPMFVKKPRSSDAYEGDTVIIFCEVVGDPKPEVVWLRDFLKPEYYKDAPHFRPIGDGPEYRLEIPCAKLDFTGTYSVIATNCHGETQAIISLQIKAKVISKENEMEKAAIRHGNVETFPSVIRHLKDLRCCDGDSIKLECHVEAVPEPIVMWEKDGHILPSDKDFEMSYNGTRATLSIPRVYPEDEGEYTCIATNNIGRSFSSACVLVDVPEEKENLLSRQLARPSGLILSANSTPRSTPRATPIRNVSPLRLSFRNTSIDLITQRRQFAAPKFYSIPYNRVVEEGESVRFQCAIAGHPLPWSTWDKDGMIVAQTSRISVKERDDLRVLEIDEITFEDAGLYRITLENDYGRIEATARLDVIASSRYNRSRSMRGISNSPRRNLYISRRIMGPSTRIGGRMALSCSFRGSSVPVRKFYHNGDEIIESERCHIYLTDNDACLVIDDVNKTDEGIYTCIAESEYGLLTTTTSVAFYDTIEDIPIELPKIIRQLPKELRTYEGETVDLSFEINETCEPYSYIWTRNGEILTDCDEFMYIDNGNGILALRILDTFDLDAGFYTCTIKTRNGSCTTTCDLIVDEERFNDLEQTNLTILKNPLPSIGLQGSIVSFCAKVYPFDSITKWIVCGREITSESRKFSLESHPDGVRILHILGIEYNHSGEIKFQIEHPIKPIQLYSYTDLIVLPNQPISIFDFDTEINNYNPDVPVLITRGPKDCTALIGGTISLDVQFGGRPIPKVNWFKAGRTITESSNIIVNTSEINSILKLKSITTDDSGKYTVEIMNEHSNDYAVASVAVEGPPEPPGGKPSISQGPDRIAIAWCGPPYDGGCMITGFIIEMQENDSDWIEIATVVDSLAYTIKNILPNIKYKFRVRAENIHGRSEPSLSSDDVTITNNNRFTEYNNNNDNNIEQNSVQNPISIRQGGEFKERFEMLEELGKGRFGVVYKVMEKETEQIMAAKIIKCIKSRDRIKVQEEIKIMKSLQHPKLLQLAAHFETVREIYMVMEYITGGELFERVVADDFTLTERDCILFIRQICEGVDYMHSQSIVHLDLKPENIMCHTRTSHQIKIIDFGLAQKLDNNSPIRVLFGTPEFIAPEIINYEPISFQTDMWSIGVICYVLLSGLSPFMGDADVDTFANITRADYDFDDDAFDAVSQEAKDFISNLLVHRKEERLTAKECIESKWLEQYQDENLSNNKICTDKLKKFIIRRKWQKTGNAIRALGRMASLSASRRNSAVSGTNSIPNSPRPSISIGYGSLLNQNHQTIHHMTSVNEEDDDTNSLLLLPDRKISHNNGSKMVISTTQIKTITSSASASKIRDKSQCSERSDSGFSECSTCSGNNGNSILCLCPSHQLLGKTDVIKEEPIICNIEKSNELSIPIPHDILKLKLEEIAKHNNHDYNYDDNTELHIDELDQLHMNDDNFIENTNNNNKINSSSLENFSIQIPLLEHQIISKNKLENNNYSLRISSSVPSIDTNTPNKTIMKSDFTNTIKMRKKSLESNFIKDKQKLIKSSKLIVETSGKVTMLKSRFNQLPSSTPSNSNFVRGQLSTKSFQFRRSPVVVDDEKNACDLKQNNRINIEHKNVFDRLAYNNKNNATKTNILSSSSSSVSVPNSPLPQLRSTASPMRLSGRVREATERLSTPKSYASTTKPFILSTSGKRTTIKQNIDDTTIENNNHIKNINKNNLNINNNNKNTETDTKNYKFRT